MSDIASVLSKEFPEIQRTSERTFTLKRICDMTGIYIHLLEFYRQSGL